MEALAQQDQQVHQVPGVIQGSLELLEVLEHLEHLDQLDQQATMVHKDLLDLKVT